MINVRNKFDFNSFFHNIVNKKLSELPYEITTKVDTDIQFVITLQIYYDISFEIIMTPILGRWKT